MGMDIGAALVVGLPSEEVCDYEEFYDKYDGELDDFSLYYDADWEARIVGYQLAGETWMWSEVNVDTFKDDVDNLKQKFKELTGKDAKVFVTANVW